MYTSRRALSSFQRMTIEQYNKIAPYKEVVQLFAKCGEYVGGCDGLFQIMHKEHGMELNTGCQSCMSAMLIRANELINEYESNRN